MLSSSVLSEKPDENIPEQLIDEPECTNKRIPPKVKRKRTFKMNYLTHWMKQENIQTLNASEENSDDAFAHYVKMHLKEIADPMLKEKASLEIQEILYKYQMECINK